MGSGVHDFVEFVFAFFVAKNGVGGHEAAEEGESDFVQFTIIFLGTGRLWEAVALEHFTEKIDGGVDIDVRTEVVFVGGILHGFHEDVAE